MNGRLSKTEGYAEFFLLTFAVLKPYYLLPSGSVGAADVCLMAGVVLYLADMLGKRTGFRHIPDREDKLLYVFVAAAAAVNLVYTVVLGSRDFIKPTVFWVYNAAAVWAFRKAVRAGGRRTLKRLDIVFKFNIAMQAVIVFSGQGRLFIEGWGATRCMGTFNDPNQLAFFMFMMMLFVYLYAVNCPAGRQEDAERRYPAEDAEPESRPVGAKRLKLTGFIAKYQEKLTAAVMELTALAVIAASKSTGVLLGVCVFVGLAWLNVLYSGIKGNGCPGRFENGSSGKDSGKINSKNSGNFGLRRKLIIGFSAAAIMLAAAFTALIWPPADFDIEAVDYNMLTRIQQKLWVFSNGGGFNELVAYRGIDRLLEWPAYMLFGSGEGGYDRWISIGPVNEIHSCFFGILFCYGIIPTLLLTVWVIKRLRSAGRWELSALIALISESMLLVNYRQPLFWWIMVYSEEERRIEKSDSEKP